MSAKKDKQKILGEVFDDQRVRSFLELQPPAGVDRDFHLMERAYRSMNIDNFATFMGFFCAAGYRVEAQSNDGKTLLQIVREHRLGQPYAEILGAHGAQTSAIAQSSP